jgi:hypothetical protein
MTPDVVAALAAGVRRAADAQGTVAPGSGPLAAAPDTAYRRWVRAGASRVTNAAARGMRAEDPAELRRRLPSPVTGRPEFSMHGRLAGRVEGHILLWRDRSDPDTANHAADIALVAAAPGEVPAPSPPYRTARFGAWLAVVHDLGPGPRTVAGLDALAAEAARMAGDAR